MQNHNYVKSQCDCEQDHTKIVRSFNLNQVCERWLLDQVLRFGSPKSHCFLTFSLLQKPIPLNTLIFEVPISLNLLRSEVCILPYSQFESFPSLSTLSSHRFCAAFTLYH